MENTEDDLVPLTASEDRGMFRGMKLKYAVEIPLILIMFGSILGGTPLGNLLMYRTCVHSLSHPVEVCRSFLEPEVLNHTQELEEEVQAYSTQVTTAKAVLEGLGPAVLSLFVGVWSDRHGRKSLLVWPMLGAALNAMLTVMYSCEESLGPWWILVTVIPTTMGGAIILLLMGVFCHISDVTPKKNRSFRIVLIQVTIAVATTTAGLVSPYVLKAVGTVYLLLIVAALHTLAYAFTNIFIEESLPNTTPGTILTVFDLSHVKELIRACFQKKPNYGRAIVLLSVAASTLSIFTVYGSHTLTYLYSRNRIQWTMKDFTMFSAASTTMWFMGSFLGVTVIQRYFHLSDLNFVAISYFSCIVEFTIKTFATKTWQMYVGSAISLFGTISGPLIRSFLTKSLPAEDIAKVFGFMGATDAFLPLLSPVLYNSIYTATISSFPQSIMLVTLLINVACFVLILIVQYLRNKTSTVGYQVIDQQSNET